MSEYLSSDDLVANITQDLGEAHPGIIEEWERQREDSDEWFPDFREPTGLAWWLQSEVSLANDFIREDTTGEDTPQERALQSFCLDAIEKIEAARKADPVEYRDPGPKQVEDAEYLLTSLVGAAVSLGQGLGESADQEKTAQMIEVYISRIKGMISGGSSN